MTSKRYWFVRAGEGGTFADEFLSGGIVAIGWKEVGPLESGVSDSDLEKRFQSAFPATKEGSRRVWSAQTKRFTREIKLGDPVVTYGPERRIYYLGVIDSDVFWRDVDLARTRRVKWTGQVLRDVLSASTKNTLGSIATLFLPSEEASAELTARAVSLGAEESPAEPPAPPTDDTSQDELREEAVNRAGQLIEDQIAALEWDDLQELVAGVLRAMGYKTRVSPPGSDRGVDIFASPDGLGLQDPRIFVEVKHRKGTPMGSQEIRAFLGGRRPGDKCIYVSTGGFSKDAKYEANRSTVPLELLTLPELRGLVVEHYEDLDSETRSLLPLRKIYWPAR